MAITLKNRSKKQGFALLIAVIFMSVMLAFGLALSSLSYKQELLASSAIESQYAFYAADAALECALYADQQQNDFDYSSHNALNAPNAVFCDATPATQLAYAYNASALYLLERFSLDANTHCADVAVYKYRTPQGSGQVTTYILSQGYNVPCATVASPGQSRFTARGINTYY